MSAEESLFPDLSLKARNGWLSPDGKLYECDFYGHGQLAHDLGLRYRGALLGVRDWIHLQNGWFREPRATWEFHEDAEVPPRVTQAQIDTIFDWCLKNKAELPPWLKKFGTETRSTPKKRAKKSAPKRRGEKAKRTNRTKKSTRS